MAAGGIAYAAIPSSGGAVRSPLGSPGVNVSIHVNGTPTSMVCTIGSGRRRCSDKTHSAAVNEGDLVDAFAVNNTGSDVYVSWSVRVG